MSNEQRHTSAEVWGMSCIRLANQIVTPGTLLPMALWDELLPKPCASTLLCVSIGHFFHMQEMLHHRGSGVGAILGCNHRPALHTLEEYS